MRIVNAYTVVPNEIKPGDVMLFTIKAMVMHQDDDDKLVYRLYRCPWDGDADNLVPQGHQIANMEDVCKVLFPSLALVGRPG